MVRILYELIELVVKIIIVIVFRKGFFDRLHEITRDDNGAGVFKG